MKTKSCIYCIYISQSVIAGEEVTIIQSCMDHNSSISREVCSVQHICQVDQGNVFIVPKREGESNQMLGKKHMFHNYAQLPDKRKLHSKLLSVGA